MGIGTSIYKGVKASQQAKKDRAESEALKKPFEQVQSEYYKNAQLAGQQASQGLSGDTKNFLTTEAQRGLGTSLSSVEAGGGGVNDVSRLLQGYQSNLGAIGAQDAEMHQKNIQYYMNANKDLAGQKTTQWAVNEYQPYENKLKELTERRAADALNVQDAINTGYGSLTSFATANQNSSLLKNLFAKQKTGVEDPYTADRWTKPQTAAIGGTGAVASPAASYPTLNPNSGSGGIQNADDMSNTSLYPLSV